jgi:single-strand DNA-binding protein
MSVNKVILIGNVGKDPEVRYLENDVAVANFTLATTDRAYTTKSGQQIPERTEWHNIVVWRGLAKVVESYVKKGSPIYIEGKLRSRSYDDKDGIKRYITEVYVDNLELLGRKSDGAPQPSGSQSASNPQVQSPSTGFSQAPFSSNTAQPLADNGFLGGEDSDDLPF